MAIYSNQIGLNITEEKLQLIELVFENNEYLIENVDEEYFEELISENTKDGKFIFVLQNAFNQIILRKNINSTKISVSLPNSFFKFFSIPVDSNLSKESLKEHINWEFSKLFPTLNIKNFSIRHTLSNIEENKIVRNAFVYAIETRILKLIHKFCARNNLLIKNIDNCHIASTALMQIQNKNSEIFTFFIENKKISSILFKDDNLVYVKHLFYDNISDISHLLISVIQDIENQALSHTIIDYVYVTGNVISDKLINTLNKQTPYKISLIDPFTILKTKPTLNNKIIEHNKTRFAPSLGMALRAT